MTLDAAEFIRRFLLHDPAQRLSTASATTAYLPERFGQPQHRAASDNGSPRLEASARRGRYS